MRRRFDRAAAPSIPWAQLGWAGECPPEGPVAILVIAPWCPDCREHAPRYARSTPRGRRAWLAGEFAPEAEVEAFARELGIGWPRLQGTHAKTEQARLEARFRQLREAAGDVRKWGVPLWVEGRLENGVLRAERLEWP